MARTGRWGQSKKKKKKFRVKQNGGGAVGENLATSWCGKKVRGSWYGTHMVGRM